MQFEDFPTIPLRLPGFDLCWGLKATGLAFPWFTADYQSGVMRFGSW